MQISSRNIRTSRNRRAIAMRRNLAWQENPRGLFVYVVACVGLNRTDIARIKLTRGRAFDQAKNEARKQYPKRLAYSTLVVQRDA